MGIPASLTSNQQLDRTLQQIEKAYGKEAPKPRLLPTPSGTSNSHAVRVRLGAAARVLIHEVVALLGSLGYPPVLSG